MNTFEVTRERLNKADDELCERLDEHASMRDESPEGSRERSLHRKMAKKLDKAITAIRVALSFAERNAEK
jgi:hypothetical protein